MFATLLGALPRPSLSSKARPEDVLETVVRAQETAGLEPLTDGGFGIGDSAAERWRRTASLTSRAVKHVLVGPFTAGQDAAVALGRADDVAWLEAVLAAVAPIRGDIVALVAAGCPIVEIREPAAISIGTDESRRALFRDAHAQLLDGIRGVHLSLAITGGDADDAGADTVHAAPYASIALDLIEGPDNWRLAAATPGDRGIICGALSTARDAEDRPEVLLWALDYAASIGGRGPSRVGLASASSMAHLPWEVAVRKMAVLGDAVRLAELPLEDRRLGLDPRAVDIRSAAMGRMKPPGRTPERPRHRGADRT